MPATAVDHEHSVTPRELFFDLVFVFAFTQVTTLLANDPTFAGIGRGVLVLAALWCLTYHCCEPMKLWTGIARRRQMKAHDRYLAERARQQVLQDQDAKRGIRGVAKGLAGWSGMFGHWQ
jgi:hypothetical protein